MGSNKTFQQKGDSGRMVGESDEFRRLRRASEKALGDRDRAIRNVCRLYGVRTIYALPGAIRAATLALVGRTCEIFPRGTDEATEGLGCEYAARPSSAVGSGCFALNRTKVLLQRSCPRGTLPET